MTCDRQHCEHEFTPRRKDQRFCSARCRRAAWTLAHAERPQERFTNIDPSVPSQTTPEAFRAAQRAA